METAQAASQRQRSVRERWRERLKGGYAPRALADEQVSGFSADPAIACLEKKYRRGVADMAWHLIGAANGMAVSETDARNKTQVKRAGDGSSGLASERDRCY